MRIRMRCRSTKRGFTLIEALTTATVLSIISVGVMMMYTSSLRMYKQGQREATSRDKAALALERILPEIRESYNVDYPGPSIIVFTMPQRGADGRYSVDPTTQTALTGKQVVIYQAGTSGMFDEPGRYVWRAERANESSAWGNRTLIMDDVEDLSFTYAPSIDMLELVQVAVTVGQGIAPSYFNRTEVGEVYIRNH
jgi:prepilin-type N-terminal cleavage/methylation domain-containing protein